MINSVNVVNTPPIWPLFSASTAHHLSPGLLQCSLVSPTFTSPSSPPSVCSQPSSHREVHSNPVLRTFCSLWESGPHAVVSTSCTIWSPCLSDLTSYYTSCCLSSSQTGLQAHTSHHILMAIGKKNAWPKSWELRFIPGTKQNLSPRHSISDNAERLLRRSKWADPGCIRVFATQTR